MELSKSKAALISSLSAKKMRSKYGLFTVEGEKSVFDMIDSFKPEIFVATSEWANENNERTAKLGIQVYEAPMSVIKKISSLTTPSPVIAVYKIPELKPPVIRKDKLYLLLDGIQDPGNLGTIIRTCDWFGVDCIFASNSTVDVYNPKTVQSTMGSLKRVNVFYGDLEKLIDQNPEMPIYGTLLNGKNIFKETLRNYGFLVMGNEGNGISEGLRKKIKLPLLIPPFDESSHGESLNVAIATAIALSRFRFG